MNRARPPYPSPGRAVETSRGVPTRRDVLLGGLGLVGAGALAACSGRAATDPTATTAAVPAASPLSATPGQRVVTARLVPRTITADLGGVHAATWAYGDTVPGTPIRATAGDLVRVTVANQLPAETSVHWHGIRVRNAADGVPGLTQEPIAAGAEYRYEFTAPDPGTYFFHPHTGVQIDRGLYAPLIVDDPHEPGRYDAEWIVTLDDWTDGVGPSPDDILAGFKAQKGTVRTGMNGMGMSGMGTGSAGTGMGRMMGGAAGTSAAPGGATGDMGMGGMGMAASPLGDAGDIAYPHYLINGRIPAAPVTLSAKPGQRVRIRFINAGSDTIFRVALGGHRLTVTHADGYPVVPTAATAVYLAMGERLDAEATLGDGAFPLVALAEGKQGRAFAVVRTSPTAATPPATASPSELAGTATLATQLRPAESALLAAKDPDASVGVELDGQMRPYAWGLNGTVFGQDTPITVHRGQRVRLRMTNMTMMAHPMHLHGHTWSLPGSGGLRKDTVLVLPMQTVEADLQADNPGVWAYHCHNIYHAEVGMMTTVRYA